jgi:hypothetical protein
VKVSTGKREVLKPSASETKLLIFASACLLASCFYFLSRALAPRSASGPGQGQRQLVRIKVKGRMQLPPGTDPARVVARVHLPEVPLDAVRQGKELFSDSSGHFSIDVQLLGQHEPRKLMFLAGLPGCGKIELPALWLKEDPHGSDDPNETNLICTVGDLQLSAEHVPATFVFPSWGARIGSRSFPALEPSSTFLPKKKRS